MDAQLRILRIIHAAMLTAALLYVWIGEVLVRDETREISPLTYLVLAVLAVIVVGSMFAVREKFLGRPSEMLRTQPDDGEALRQWRGGYLIMMSMAEAVVLYGFLVRMIGAPLARTVPFYVVYPRRP